MSQYVEFFAKVDEIEKPVYLFCFSSASPMYEIFQPFAPYGKATELTRGLLQEARTELSDALKEERYVKKSLKKELKYKVRAALDFDYLSARDNIREYKERIKSFKKVELYIDLLDEFLTSFDSNIQTLYVGIEVPSDYWQED